MSKVMKLKPDNKQTVKNKHSLLRKCMDIIFFKDKTTLTAKK
jgi:hypothetical protein